MILPASAMPIAGGNSTLGVAPLDVVTNAAAAWSVGRRLRTGYTGNAFQAQKAVSSSFTSPEVQVGFLTDGRTNAAGLQSAMSPMASNEFVRIENIFDQSGNGRDINRIATDATLCPIIGNQVSPVFNFFRGNLCFSFASGLDANMSFGQLTLSGDYTVIVLALADNTNGSIIGGAATANGHNNTSFDHATNGARFQDRVGVYSEPTTSYPTNQIKTLTYRAGGTGRLLRVNGVTRSLTTIAQTRNNVVSLLGSRRTGASTYANFSGFCSEIYIFTRALSESEYRFIENSMMTFYGAS